MLEPSLTDWLKQKKNLLAFSGGVDSTALFHLLRDAEVPFDLAIINYHTRPQSDEEVAFAQTLAEKYDKQIHIHDASLDFANFEHAARRVRYNFFESLIEGQGYDTLLLAHQLNDQLEWFLMQLAKGAGLAELLGMEVQQERGNYTLVRPLLHISRQKILDYLHQNKLHYFEDKSNESPAHTRNRFRQQFANPLMEQYGEGIARSFTFLQQDKVILQGETEIRQHQNLYILMAQKHLRQTLHAIDKVLKKLGILPSHAQKQEILHTRNCVISGKVAVVFQNERIFIAPYKTTPMEKAFKERCRVCRIPTKIRPYLKVAEIAPETV